MTQETVKGLAKVLAHKDSIYLIGRKRSHSIALESALKIKELTYIHAESICAGELKHGVIALINSNPRSDLDRTPFIIFALENDQIH